MTEKKTQTPAKKQSTSFAYDIKNPFTKDDGIVYICIDLGTTTLEAVSNYEPKVPERQTSKIAKDDLENLPEGVHAAVLASYVTTLNENGNNLKNIIAQERGVTVEELGDKFFGQDGIGVESRMAAGKHPGTYTNGSANYVLHEAEVAHAEDLKALIENVVGFYDHHGKPMRICIEGAPTLLYNAKKMKKDSPGVNIIKDLEAVCEDLDVDLIMLPQTSGTAIYAGMGEGETYIVIDNGGGTDDVHFVHAQDPQEVGTGELGLLKNPAKNTENICGRWLDEKALDVLHAANEQQKLDSGDLENDLLYDIGTATKINKRHAHYGSNVPKKLTNYKFSFEEGGGKVVLDISEKIGAIYKSILKPMADLVVDVARVASKKLAAGNKNLDPEDLQAKALTKVVLSGQGSKGLDLAPSLEEKIIEVSGYDEEDYDDEDEAAEYRPHVAIVDNPTLGPALGGLRWLMSLSEDVFN